MGGEQNIKRVVTLCSPAECRIRHICIGVFSDNSADRAAAAAAPLSLADALKGLQTDLSHNILKVYLHTSCGIYKCTFSSFITSKQCTLRLVSSPQSTQSPPPVLILTFRSRCPQLCHVVSPGRARVPLPLPGFFLLPCSAVSALIVSPSSVTAPPAVWEEPTVMDANHFARVPVHPRRLSQQAQPRLSPLLGS